MENGAGAEGTDPSGFLSEIIGSPVTVKLNSGVVYKGSSSRTKPSVVNTDSLLQQGSFSQSTAT